MVNEQEKNWAYVQILLSATRDIKSVDAVPSLLKQVIENHAWQEFYCEPMRKVIEYTKFRDFVEAKSPYGLGTTVERLMDICSGNNLYDEETGMNLGVYLKGLIRELVAGSPGGANHTRENIESKINNNNIIIDCDDNNKKGPKQVQGTSASYGIDRLKRAAQTDDELKPLLEAVMAGKKSVNKALVEAGIRPKTATFTLEPDAMAVGIARKFTHEQVLRIIELLQEVTR